VTIGIDPSVLTAWYQTSWNTTGTGAPSGTGTTSGASAATAQYAPTPPWSSGAEPSQSKLVTSALNGTAIIDPSAAKLDLPGASADYKNLFALYQGVDTLYGLASQASQSNTSSYQLTQLSSAFASGLAQLQSFVSGSNFSQLRLTTGTTTNSETADATTPTQPTTYQTAALNTTGDSAAVIPAFQGDVQFNVTVQAGGGAPTTIAMNLADMGSTPRTMANVVSYLNGQMAAAGAITTFSVNAMPAQPDVIQVGGKSVTVSTGQSQWGLQINTNAYETVSLSAPTTTPAVYIGQVVGNQNSSIAGNGTTTAPDDQSQLLKLQVGSAAASSPDPGTNAAPAQLFKDQLGNTVTSVQDTQTAADGSVYVLANVAAPTAGSSGTSASTGTQDVALLHYDSAGNLLFQSDLGSASNATGLSLAVSADGSQVAVAGQVTGPLTTGQTLENPTGANSFVTVFDSEGNQVWSHESDGVTGNQANAVAFGADGTVYVAGQSATAYNGALTPSVPSSGYLQVLSSTGTEVSDTAIGTTGSNSGVALAVDGTNVYVASIQNGDAVVNQYDASTPSAPTLTASRDLGDLQNGNIAGIAVQNGTIYVAGSTHNGALAAGAVTSAYSGSGLNAFAATLSTGLAPASTDSVAYYGGASGDTTAQGMAVSNGEVFITGSATGALPGQPAIGAKDGYAAELNVAAGTVDWSQRFTGLDGQVAPTSISVASSGASVLDQLGLPSGLVDGPVSDLLTASGAVKVGDSFGIATNGGSTTKITIQAGDTMQSLAREISRVTGSQVNVSLKQTATANELVIQPLDPNSTVTLSDGPAGADALAGLGLKAGILYDTTKQGGTAPADGKGPVFGLGLSPNLDLASATDIKHAQSQLAAAMSVIKSAYQALKTAATPANVLALQKLQATQGAAPAYLTAQIASYQSALSRLTAGQTSTTSVGA